MTGEVRAKTGTTLTNSYNASIIGYAGTGAGQKAIYLKFVGPVETLLVTDEEVRGDF